jgi:hypothetical protein
MAEFVFTSPGVKFRERDLTFVTRNVGITTLGLVGETLKGPAFEPVFVQDKTEFSDRFGAQSTKRFSNGNLQYQLPYVANAYLDESNQLYVTRVLGLSGYDAGKAWAITLEAGVDPDTVVSGATSAFTATFADNVYMGVTLNASGDTGTTFTGFERQTDTAFTGTSYQFTATTVNTDGTGTVSVISTEFNGTEYTDYEAMVLAVIRSRGITQDQVNSTPITLWDTKELSIIANETILDSGDLFGEFTLQATNTGTTTSGTSGSTETYTASLDPNSSSYLPNVIGSQPKDKNTKIWVEQAYPDLIKWLDAYGDTYPTGLTSYGITGIAAYGFGINTTLLVTASDATGFADYKTNFQTPETPWVVSQLKGSDVDRLFKFISISDGDAANREIKISIVNINPISLEFDVVIRDFTDTDDNPTILETFSRCTLIKGQNNYIAQRIGTSDGEYDLQSKYVMIELASDEIAADLFPAGFEGYNFKNWAVSATSGNYAGVTPEIKYKTEYNDSERIKKVYLGVSENAYDVWADSSEILKGTGVNQNFFNFFGQSGFVNSKGFHMDSGATGSSYNGFEFEVGAGQFRTISDAVDPTNPYYDINTRKFTLVPAGGFDGWDVNRTERSYGDLYRANGIYDGVEPNGSPMNDFQAWETAINTFSNPEEVTINLFATPGINWSDQNILIQNTLEMLEDERTDSLYVIDSPDVTVPTVVGETKSDVVAANDIVDLLDSADVDSSYACTYFPWIQMRDTQNNVNVYIPPTGEVVAAMAYTDNTSFPWFAPAGLNRGVTDARKSKYKLSLDARDILYNGRINPLADFADSGTAIFGQKTLQVRESALDRINVRRLLLQVKVLISNIAIRLVFEQNDQATIDQFLAKATPVLDNIKRERGLQEFRIKMDDSNNTTETRDRNELYGEIFLKPTRAVEFIGITFTITPSGASFDEAGA